MEALNEIIRDSRVEDLEKFYVKDSVRHNYEFDVDKEKGQIIVEDKHKTNTSDSSETKG